MSSTAEQVAVERTVEVAARPETIWEFLVDPEKAVRWMGTEASLEPRLGGLYRVAVVPGFTARGEFVELDPPRRLVFTWGWESNEQLPPGDSTVEIELIPSKGGTTVRLVHRDLPTAESGERHAHGWMHYLERLATAASGGDPGRDTMLDRAAPERVNAAVARGIPSAVPAAL